MNSELTIIELRTALGKFYLAGISMPRHTPNPGVCSTEHTYKLPASSVWALDEAMQEAAELLGITDLPANCCVGNRLFDQETAWTVAENAREILSRFMGPAQKGDDMRIRIIKTPPGRADQHIRDAWVGIEMPAKPDKRGVEGWDGDDNAGGYIVSGVDAVEALNAAGKTEAAVFWSNPMPPVSLRFGADYCEVVSN